MRKKRDGICLRGGESKDGVKELVRRMKRCSGTRVDEKMKN